MNQKQGFTGRARKRQTRWSVRVADRAARSLITIGGIGTIVAVSTIFVFLAWVVVPLFLPASSEPFPVIPLSKESAGGGEVLHVAMDEQQVMGMLVRNNGVIESFRTNDGELLERRALFDGRKITSSSFSIDGTSAAFGFEDGSISLAKFMFVASFHPTAELPQEYRGMQIGERKIWNQGVVQRIDDEQFRLHSLKVEIGASVSSSAKSPITLLDHSIRASGTILASYAGDGRVRIALLKERKNAITGKKTSGRAESEIVLEESVKPSSVLVSGLGDNVYILESKGRMLRYDTRNPAKPVLRESLPLFANGQGSGTQVTAAGFLVGKTTLVIGNSAGGIEAWFPAKSESAETGDGTRMIRAHEFEPRGSAVRSLASSARTRLMAAGFDDGQVQILHVTTGRWIHAVVAEDLNTDKPMPILQVAMAPKDDGFLALADRVISRWSFNPRHPEVTMASLLTPVWYEGYEHPAHVWQSTGGTDQFEPKLGLLPLIFGTIKATVYCMLFGVPLAILGAIHTSEFLTMRAKMRIKPAIELMASLPSVVLGFLAAIVFAPIIEQAVPITIAAFFTVPLAFLLGAFFWQFLPQGVAIRLARFRLAFVIVCLPIGVAAAALLGPVIDRVLFAGDIKLWLDHQRGSGASGWFLLFLPLSAAATMLFMANRVNPWFRRISAGWSRSRCAAGDLLRFLAATALTVLLACVATAILASMGLDPRGSVVGTYVQRNALVVGFVMGFAVIPIIYTIAEDALSTVPEHLRSASLGAGATVWQTTVRIIIPTAMSGLFSAVMVGLGRAVGETMIVLMAAGNTPIMDWNIFNGFRTLSANIAVELAEAVRDSTHYRTLFLASFALFLLTFVLNTVAEIVRLRFRKRAYEL
ncbi:MAG: ABC transporter permease [Planctomycetota bacterium]